MAVTAQIQEELQGSKFVGIACEYRGQIEGEIEELCVNTIGIVEACLMNKQSDLESEVFLWKMKADYYRYMAECLPAGKAQKAAEEAYKAYKTANVKAKAFQATNVTRLGLALSYSTFFYEVLNSPMQAYKLAKTGFDEAFAEQQILEEEPHKDSVAIMQLLRDNLTLWSADIQAE